jgi:O-acetyl-ADP-ribose deacetylase (regulator of RNase III)
MIVSDNQPISVLAYDLPAKYIIHTVGPTTEMPDVLRLCYRRSMAIAEKNKVWSLAFPCISTGYHGYDPHKAAQVALGTVRDYLLEKSQQGKKPVSAKN